ncbi:uncharacterized protein ISCGN_003804 [Ixodes scapularis]
MVSLKCPVRLATLNVRGLADRRRQRQLYRLVVEQDLNIIAVQETKVESEDRTEFMVRPFTDRYNICGVWARVSTLLPGRRSQRRDGCGSHRPILGLGNSLRRYRLLPCWSARVRALAGRVRRPPSRDCMPRKLNFQLGCGGLPWLPIVKKGRLGCHCDLQWCRSPLHHLRIATLAQERKATARFRVREVFFDLQGTDIVSISGSAPAKLAASGVRSRSQRHVEVLHFAAQRVCSCLGPTKAEQVRLRTLKRDTFVLEFFEDFYAGFVQVLLQVYLIILFLSSNNPSNALIGQLVGSALSLWSLIRAVQRKDDGLLTGTLSFLGWLAVAASRGLALSLLTSVIHGWIVVACLVHGVAMTAWIASFVWEAHRRLDSVRQPGDDASQPLRSPCITLILIFALFGLPSLIFWPVMFDFKLKRRVFLFIFVFVVENLLCFGVWQLWGSDGMPHTYVVLLSALFLGLTTAAIFFIALYVCCKPEKVDLVVLHHIREDNANKYGIYFDFCKVIRILPDTKDIARDLEKIRMLKLVK